ncbi:hypothetical protein BJX62DRAFT_233135 [Aspergillus germanicus]
MVWTFYRKFEYFIVKYATSTLQKLSSSSSITPPSISEEIRVKRAFSRCEIYICLFQISQMTHRDTRFPAPSTDPASAYIQALRPCEIEQVYCVLEFYMTLVEQICIQMDDELVSMTTTASGGTMTRGDGGVERYRTRTLSRVGTLAMWKLTHIPYVAARKIFVYTWQTAHEMPSIMFHLENLPRQHASEDSHSDLDGNFGWSWAGADAMYHHPYGLPGNCELRKQGYVFWNKTRLVVFPQFCASRTKERNLTELPPGYTDYVDTPGVVARLADLTVDVQVVTAISEEIRDEVQPGDAEDHNKAEDIQDSENEKDSDQEKRAANGNDAGDDSNAEDEKNAGDAVDTDDSEDPEYPEPVPYLLRWRD